MIANLVVFTFLLEKGMPLCSIALTKIIFIQLKLSPITPSKSRILTVFSFEQNHYLNVYGVFLLACQIIFHAATMNLSLFHYMQYFSQFVNIYSRIPFAGLYCGYNFANSYSEEMKSFPEYKPLVARYKNAILAERDIPWLQ